jgi:hypothetical protein
VTSDENAPAGRRAGATASARRRLRRSSAPIAAVALALGLAVGTVGGLLARAPATPAADEAAAGNSTGEPVELAPGEASQLDGRGDPGAAYRWFEKPRAPFDVAAFTVDPRIDRVSMRLVYANRTFGRVWVAQSIDLELCLVVRDAVERGRIACADPLAFRDHGLRVSVTSEDSDSTLFVRWDGVQVLVAIGSE